MEPVIDAVELALHTKDGRSREIPLEAWQLEGLALYKQAVQKEHRKCQAREE